MTIQEMKQRANELGYSNDEIAMYVDVCPEVIDALFGEPPVIPEPPTMEILDMLFSSFYLEPSPLSDTYDSYETFNASRECEPIAAYGYQRSPEHYTIHDYYQLPNDHRYELIDGKFYYMAAPSHTHQLLVGFLFYKFQDHVVKHKGACLPMVSPTDVQLDRNLFTMLQPDMLIVCDKSKLIDHCLYGAPDFVLEVLSPSTRRKDISIKVPKYMKAGVKECWLIDPQNKQVLVYTSDEPATSVIYDFDSKVPVQIWNGDCEIDFSEVYEYVRFLYE